MMSMVTSTSRLNSFVDRMNLSYPSVSDVAIVTTFNLKSSAGNDEK